MSLWGTNHKLPDLVMLKNYQVGTIHMKVCHEYLKNDQDHMEDNQPCLLHWMHFQDDMVCTVLIASNW